MSCELAVPGCSGGSWVCRQEARKLQRGLHVFLLLLLLLLHSSSQHCSLICHPLAAGSNICWPAQSCFEPPAT
jgi:hypothetical protein